MLKNNSSEYFQYYKQPDFQIETINSQITRQQGLVSTIKACNDCVYVVTQDQVILRYNYQDPSESTNVSQVSLKQSKQWAGYDTTQATLQAFENDFKGQTTILCYSFVSKVQQAQTTSNQTPGSKQIAQSSGANQVLSQEIFVINWKNKGVSSKKLTGNYKNDTVLCSTVIHQLDKGQTICLLGTEEGRIHELVLNEGKIEKLQLGVYSIKEAKFESIISISCQQLEIQSNDNVDLQPQPSGTLERPSATQTKKENPTYVMLIATPLRLLMYKFQPQDQGFLHSTKLNMQDKRSIAEIENGSRLQPSQALVKAQIVGDLYFTQQGMSELYFGILEDYQEDKQETHESNESKQKQNQTSSLLWAGFEYTSKEQDSVQLSKANQHQIVEEIKIAGTMLEDTEVLGLVLSKLHMLACTLDAIFIFNVFDGKFVQKIDLPQLAGGKFQGICQDPVSGVIFVYSNSQLYEISCFDEESNAWYYYLIIEQYEKALQLCADQSQNDIVLCKQAEALFKQGKYDHSAKIYGQIVSNDPSFEEIALKFNEIGQNRGLRTFLNAKLNKLTVDDRPQATMLAVWILELYLSTYSSSFLRESDILQDDDEQKDNLSIKHIKDFLTEFMSILDPLIVKDLLNNYGQMELLLFYAQKRGQDEEALEYLLHLGDTDACIRLLRSPNISDEALYKVISQIIRLDPVNTIDLLIRKSASLDHRRVMLSFLQFAESQKFKNSPIWKYMLNYINHCFNEQGVQDRALHHFAISLYTLQQDEEGLITYLKTAYNQQGEILYDPEYALQLSYKRKCYRASVYLLQEIGNQEEAIQEALKIDVQLAKQVIKSSKVQDETMLRRMWFKVGQYLLQQNGKGSNGYQDGNGQINEGVIKAVEMIKETEGMFLIEDLLPLFPDFVALNQMKEVLEQLLENYNEGFRGMTQNMDNASQIVDQLQAEQQKLNKHVAVVSMEQKCARCQEPLSAHTVQDNDQYGNLVEGVIPPYYVFPSGLVFKGTCLVSEVMELLPFDLKLKLKNILVDLSRFKKAQNTAQPFNLTNASTPTFLSRRPTQTYQDPGGEKQNLIKQLNGMIATQCPRNNEIVLNLLNKPFVEEEPFDQKLIKSLAI